MLKAEEVLEAQRDLLIKLEDPIVRKYHGHTLMSPYAERMKAMGTHPLLKDEQGFDAALERSGEALVGSLRGTLQVAYAFQVTADMTPLVIAAARGLDGTDRFTNDMMPTQAGFVRFEQPLPIKDIAGKTLLAHWMLWGPSSPVVENGVGFSIYLWNDHYTEPDDIGKEIQAEEKFKALQARLGRWGGVMEMHLVAKDVRVGPAEALPESWKQKKYTDKGMQAQAATNATRYIFALWMLLQQMIVTHREVEIPRSHRKIAKRMNIPGRVTVIELRRHESGRNAEGESFVEWSHRWIVRGGWQWRHCGPDHPHAQPYEKGYRCRVWIKEHQKGPSDKPLVLTEKVYRLKR